jgi:hypothetical protein
MIVLVVIFGLVAVAGGTGLGWYLRGVNAWCPHCGDALACTCCGQRPAWAPVPLRIPRQRGPREQDV